jgi:hypothetical protein
MKILMPKEMKIRLVANVLGIVIAFINAAYAAWYIIAMAPEGGEMIILPIFSVGAAGLYFLMAKIMWALEKKTKIIGWFVLGATGFLGFFGPFGMFMEFIDPTGIDLSPLAGWSFGVAAISGVAGLLIVAGKLIGEMVEKLKFLSYIGFACIAGLVVLLALFGSSPEAGGKYAILVPAIGAFSMTLGGIGVTILGYIAESILIKKKFLVYN